MKTVTVKVSASELIHYICSALEGSYPTPIQSGKWSDEQTTIDCGYSLLSHFAKLSEHRDENKASRELMLALAPAIPAVAEKLLTLAPGVAGDLYDVLDRLGKKRGVEIPWTAEQAATITAERL